MYIDIIPGKQVIFHNKMIYLQPIMNPPVYYFVVLVSIVDSNWVSCKDVAVEITNEKTTIIANTFSKRNGTLLEFSR